MIKKTYILSQCKFCRVAAFSISLVNDRTETAIPELNSMFMSSIVDIAIYEENTLKVPLFIRFFNKHNFEFRINLVQVQAEVRNVFATLEEGAPVDI